MNWCVEAADGLAYYFATAPVWQQLGAIILVGVPVLGAVAWAIIMVIDLFAHQCKKGWNALLSRTRSRD